MTDTRDTPGARLERALGTVTDDWLASVAGAADEDAPAVIAERASALARREIPAAEEHRRDFRRELDAVATAVDGLAAECLPDAQIAGALPAAVDAVDVDDGSSAPRLVVVAGATAAVGLLVAVRERYEAVPESVAEPAREAALSAASGAYDEALDRSVESVEALTDAVPLARRVDRLTAAVASLRVPTYTELDELKRAASEAFAASDERRIARIESRVKAAAEVAWGGDDLIEPTPEEFEDLVADLWRSAADIGDVARTRRSDDAGVDVVVRFADGRTEVIQVKQFATGNTVGRPTVQQTEGVVSQFDADAGAVVTSSSFTDPARSAAAAYDSMRLFDGERLVRALRESPLVPPRALAPDR
ncbi:restriction endonuclease [Halorubrum sp. GN11_10-6_MGM]|uniref:restriction endonuclease n=1 Tax=Halorubrum sp. GN11_10-6_MGM TaxID=2518112 RepID=UPI0010F8D3A1|nr:restriction endonuclease [Halorubrum sp. GN11_10-6_MGM]TKX72474.1 restriction endonuclease [Halorubrum sp. GN11_10-6_MGM]